MKGISACPDLGVRRGIRPGWAESEVSREAVCGGVPRLFQARRGGLGRVAHVPAGGAVAPRVLSPVSSQGQCGRGGGSEHWPPRSGRAHTTVREEIGDTVWGLEAGLSGGTAPRTLVGSVFFPCGGCGAGGSDPALGCSLGTVTLRGHCPCGPRFPVPVMGAS